MTSTVVTKKAYDKYVCIFFVSVCSRERAVQYVFVSLSLITSDAEEIREGKGKKHARKKNEKKRLEDLFFYKYKCSTSKVNSK